MTSIDWFDVLWQLLLVLATIFIGLGEGFTGFALNLVATRGGI